MASRLARAPFCSMSSRMAGIHSLHSFVPPCLAPHSCRSNTSLTILYGRYAALHVVPCVVADRTRADHLLESDHSNGVRVMFVRRITISLTNTSCNGTLACLRTVDAVALNNAAIAIEQGNFLGVLTFVPVVDGSFIVERPTVTLSKKKHNAV
jgi:hypothetical protein